MHNKGSYTRVLTYAYTRIDIRVYAYVHTRIRKIRAYNTRMRSSDISELHCMKVNIMAASIEVNEVIKVGGIQNTLVLWQAVFLAASPLAMAAPPPKLYFALAIPPATQAIPFTPNRRLSC